MERNNDTDTTSRPVEMIIYDHNHNKQTNKQARKQESKKANKQTSKGANKPTNKQANKQASKQTNKNKQTNMKIKTVLTRPFCSGLFLHLLISPGTFTTPPAAQAFGRLCSQRALRTALRADDARGSDGIGSAAQTTWRRSGGWKRW